ncbi:MAG: secondary thiamine-phosphate synthase enzyme, partial [Bacteroidia bacterium]
MIHQEELRVQTPGRGTQEVTVEMEDVVSRAGVQTGTCNAFLMHTSASLVITENADPTVRTDLESWLARAVPDGDRL